MSLAKKTLIEKWLVALNWFARRCGKKLWPTFIGGFEKRLLEKQCCHQNDQPCSGCYENKRFLSKKHLRTFFGHSSRLLSCLRLISAAKETLAMGLNEWEKKKKKVVRWDIVWWSWKFPLYFRVLAQPAQIGQGSLPTCIESSRRLCLTNNLFSGAKSATIIIGHW